MFIPRARLAVLAVVVTAFALLGPPPAHAERWPVSLDTDPTTFPLGGFSGWLMTKPTAHLRVGVGGFGLDFPSFLVPILNGTGEDGWHLDVRAAMAFAGYMHGDRKGLYLGVYGGYLESRHRRDDTPGEADRDNLTLLPCIGYQWFPFQAGALRGAYLQPWAGATIWFPIGGTTTLGTHTFDDPHVIPIAAVHLGYEF